MFRTLTIGVGLTLTLLLAACTQSTAQPAIQREPSTTTKQVKTSNEPAVQVSRANFERIQLAVTENDYASTLTQVKALFGKATRTTETKFPSYEQPLKTYIWENTTKSLAGATVTISFHDGLAVAKSYQMAKLATNPRVTTDLVTKLKPGTTYSQVVTKLGPPNAVNNVATKHRNIQVLTYNQIKDQPQTAITLVFHQNELAEKTRSAL
ncbi:DUF3862 domain-containing protein [Lactiplantibacillus plajomi]|uniref:DUF3862 domain-containing protein n=1 Tax=Lactiplantibacillus plajomi TaxID=1457217 RepID=A0ABV6K1L4_9LACO|nr:DUF3862 domain-containing protein [Lactiplantibacillus plajomi]